jgi:Family of unknown function (DUF6610)
MTDKEHEANSSGSQRRRASLLERAKSSSVFMFISFGKKVMSVAKRYGWLPAARYDDLSRVRGFDRVGFLDIDWQKYNFQRHLIAVKATNPFMTVARDIEDARSLDSVLDQAAELSLYCAHVVVVPKDLKLEKEMNRRIPSHYVLGYSVPTRYGGTAIPPCSFNRPVHLLGGRPDVQRRLASRMPVVSLDCNRFTLDAIYGDYFDGEIFRPHPIGGFQKCIKDSIQNINRLWSSYHLPEEHRLERR